MTQKTTNHKITHVFEVVLERDDEYDEYGEREKERRYKARCCELSDCYIYASSKAKALRKIRLAINLWLHLADRRVCDEELSIDDRLR